MTEASEEINTAVDSADAGQPQAGRGDVQVGSTPRRPALRPQAMAPSPADSAEKPKDDVVDAEFVDVDDKK